MNLPKKLVIDEFYVEKRNKNEEMGRTVTSKLIAAKNRYGEENPSHLITPWPFIFVHHGG